MLIYVDMYVIRIGVGHGAAVVVIVNQPFNDLPLAVASIEVDGIAAGP